VPSRSSETTVLFYDEKQQPEVAPLAGGAKRANKRIPKTPANLAAAQKKLEDAKVGGRRSPKAFRVLPTCCVPLLYSQHTFFVFCSTPLRTSPTCTFPRAAASGTLATTA